VRRRQDDSEKREPKSRLRQAFVVLPAQFIGPTLIVALGVACASILVVAWAGLVGHRLSIETQALHEQLETHHEDPMTFTTTWNTVDGTETVETDCSNYPDKTEEECEEMHDAKVAQRKRRFPPVGGGE
jgi:hypothetical protein